MNNLPKIPVRFLPQNQELLDLQKSTSGQYHKSIDYTPDVDVPPIQMEPVYRTPLDRVNGNAMFRRLPDGKLDYDYAKHKIVDAIHKVKDGVELTNQEKVAVSCVFPSVFDFVDPGVIHTIRMVNLRASEEECNMVAAAVAAHLRAEEDFKHSSHAR